MSEPSKSSKSPGEELWDLIESGGFHKEKVPLTNRQRKLQAKKKRVEEASEALRASAVRHRAEIRSLAQWKVVARIVVQFEVTCTCGARHCYPETFIQAPFPLLRYKSRRDGTIWEKRAEHGTPIPRNLPTELRHLALFSDHCEDCLPALLAGEK